MKNSLFKIINLLYNRLKYPNVKYYGSPKKLVLMGIWHRKIFDGYNSQLGQDEFIYKELIENQENKIIKLFIDVGCNHPITHSNSLFFEKNQGYKVVAIDALEGIKNLWGRERPNSLFIETAVGDMPGTVDFEIVQGGEIESMFSAVSGASNKATNHTKKLKTVQVRTLAEILSSLSISAAGVVSIDIEGYELNAIKGIDFKKFRSQIFIIENNRNNGLGDNLIRDYLISKGYVYYARIWNLDDIFVDQNLI